MKAGVLYSIEDLRIQGVTTPNASEKEILIKVEVCTICGTDIRVYHYGHKHIRFPRITGHEVSGKIVEVGKKVKNYKIGQRVTVAPAVPCGECYYCRRGMQGMCLNLKAIGYHFDGGFAQFMVVPEVAIENGCVNTIPDNLSFEEAALAEPLACAINGQELSKIGLGDTVVIIGAGPLGCIHTQLARVKGAMKVILVELSPSRIDFAKNFAMPDVVINPSKDKPYIQFNSNLVHYGEFYVVGTHGSAPRHNQLALNILSGGRIKVKELITHRLPLEKLEEGIHLAESREAMKVAILPQK